MRHNNSNSSNGTYISCANCTSGKYAPNAESGTCLSCQAGYYTLGKTQSATTCYPCPPGKYNSEENQFTCQSCEPGKFTQTPGSTSCSLCSEGSYAKDYESTYCSSCADGIHDGYGYSTWSLPGAAGCYTCSSGYVLDKKKGTCITCPHGFDCTENNLDLEELPVKANRYRFTATSKSTYKCPYNHACPGEGAHYDSNSSATAGSGNTFSNQTNSSSAQTYGDALCAEGYQGPLCAVCSKGYGFTHGGTKCQLCNSGKNGFGGVRGFIENAYVQTIGLAALVLFCLALSGFVLWWCFRPRIVAFRQWSRKNKAQLDLLMSQVTTIVVTIQTGILISENHQAAGGAAPPQTYEEVVKWFDVFTLKLTLVPMDCFDRKFGFFGVLIMQTLGVIGIALILMFLWANIRIRAGCGEADPGDDVYTKLEDHAQEVPGEGPRHPAYVFRACKRTWFWVIVERRRQLPVYARYGVTFVKLVLPVVSYGIAQAFQCKRYDYGYEILNNDQTGNRTAHSSSPHCDGDNDDDYCEMEKKWLVVDYTVNCHSHQYVYGIMIYAIVMGCLLPIGMPIAALVALYRLRFDSKRAEPPTPDDEDHRVLEGEAPDEGETPDEEGKQDPPVIQAASDAQESPFAVLWRDVKSEFWYMEVLDIIRRLMLTSVTAAFSTSAEVILFSLCIALLALVCQYEFRPYKIPAMNTIKILEAWQNLLILVILLIQDAEMFSSESLYNLAGVLLLLVDALMIVIIALSAWSRGACRREYLLSSVDYYDDVYQPPFIADERDALEDLQKQHEVEKERLRERHAAASKQIIADSEQLNRLLKDEAEELRAENTELQRRLGESTGSRMYRRFRGIWGERSEMGVSSSAGTTKDDSLTEFAPEVFAPEVLAPSPPQMDGDMSGDDGASINYNVHQGRSKSADPRVGSRRLAAALNAADR